MQHFCFCSLLKFLFPLLVLQQASEWLCMWNKTCLAALAVCLEIWLWRWQSVPSRGMSLHVVFRCVGESNWDRKAQAVLSTEGKLHVWRVSVKVYQCIVGLSVLCVCPWTGDKTSFDSWGVYYEKTCVSQSRLHSRAKFGRFIRSMWNISHKQYYTYI